MAIERGETFDLEAEIITGKGNLKYVHAIGKADLIKRKVYGFVQDITERKKIEEKLHILNAELEQRVVNRTQELQNSNKELERFAYVASHDLQTPLRHIMAYTEFGRVKLRVPDQRD
jgi:signal transduction histidine kinase